MRVVDSVDNEKMGNTDNMQDQPGQARTYDFDEPDDERIVDDEGDTVWDPPEGWNGVKAVGVTADEELRGESLEERDSQLTSESFRGRRLQDGVGRIVKDEYADQEELGVEVKDDGDFSAEEAAMHRL